MQQLNRKQDILQEGVLNKHALKITAIKRALVYVTLISFLSGCIMVPKAHEFQQPKCELATKKLTIDVVGSDLGDLNSIHGDGAAAILILMGAVFTVSAVVSGSIVVAGNTVHWIEQEGTCDDGKIRNAIADLTGSLSSMGGWVVTSSKQMIDWISFWEKSEEADEIDEKEEAEAE